MSINIVHIIGICSIIYVLISRKTIFSGTQVSFVLSFLMIFLYLAFSVGIVNEQGLSSCATPIIIIVDFLPFTIYLSDYFKKHNYGLDELFSSILLVGFIQSIVAILSFFIPDLQHMLVSKLVQNGGIELYYELAAYRMYGFSSGLTFITPIIQSFLAILALVYAQGHSKLYLISSITMAFSAIINARVSIVVLAIGLVLVALNPKYSSKQRRNVILGIVLVGLIMFYIVIPLINQFSNHTFLSIFSGFTQILDFFTSGKRDIGYFAYVTNKNNYNLPSGILGVLLGKGTFVMGQNPFGFHSDVGYINDVWFGGILYILIYYINIFRIIIQMSRRKDDFLFFVAFYLLILFPVLNFKGMVFSLNGLMGLTIILYLFTSDQKPSGLAVGNIISREG